MTTGEMAKVPALFLRNATGLVKGWSGFDAFVYSFMSVNLVTLGMYYSFTVLTTTGFGDLTAAEPVGHALAVVEMLGGQLYLVTVIGVSQRISL